MPDPQADPAGLAPLGPGHVEHERPRANRTTFGFLYAICAVEGADVMLLPATFRALEADLGLRPSHLATLALCQALTASVFAPIWGSLVDHGWSRKWMLVGGAVSWGILTTLLAFITEFYAMIVLRTLNGVALASMMPVSQSIIIDLSQSHERGHFFGNVQFSFQMGTISGVVFATSLSNQTIWGFQGWRVAFVTVAMMCFLLAAIIACCMVEPGRVSIDEGRMGFMKELRKLRAYWRIPTFKVIVMQGVFGTIPWGALGFAILYFQYVGISDFHAAVLVGLFTLGCGFGGLLGGFIADSMTRWSRFHGRPMTAQISVSSGIPLVVVIYYCMPRNPSHYYWFCVLMFTFGLMAAWCACVNRPILADIVPASGRASIVAWLVALEGSTSALFGAPLVALLSENAFGYKPSRLSVAEMSPEQRQMNASALSRSIVIMCVVPWAICLACYTFLHFTYKADLASIEDDHEKGKKGKSETTPLK